MHEPLHELTDSLRRCRVCGQPIEHLHERRVTCDSARCAKIKWKLYSKRMKRPLHPQPKPVDDFPPKAIDGRRPIIEAWINAPRYLEGTARVVYVARETMNSAATVMAVVRGANLFDKRA